MLKGKAKVISDICHNIHPDSGVDKGWSEYTGGMRDTGQWFPLKMMKVHISDLLSFWNKNKPALTGSTPQQGDIVVHDLGNGAWVTEKERRSMVMHKQKWHGICYSNNYDNPMAKKTLLSTQIKKGSIPS